MASDTAKNIKKNVNEAVDMADETARKAGSRMRRAALAYLGMYGVAFEEAQARLNNIRENSDEWFNRLVEKGEEIESQAADLFGEAQEKINESTAKVRDAIRPEDKVVEIKVKTKTKPAAKKPAVKKTTAKKSSSKSSKMTGADIEKDERYEGYVNNVRSYHKKASAITIKKIVDHCGIALQNQDGRFVACADETERNTVRDSWLVKHLGVTGETNDLDAKVMAVCEQMADDHMKDRVTFYYLVAKQESKLTAI